MNYIINSPLEQFEIQTYIGINNENIDISWLSFTSITMYNIIVLSIIVLLHVLVLSNKSIVPTKWQIGIESLYFTVHNMVYSQLGEKGSRFIPLVYSLFIYILISNIVSIVPYNFAILAHLIYTVALSITVWLGVTLLGFYIHRISYLNLFVPSGTSLALAPVLVIIELISYFARALSLGLRLGANILAGHILLVILSGLIFDFMSASVLFFIIGFIPLFLVVGIMGLEIAIAIIQAYVFCTLTSSYLKDALHLH